MTLEEFKRLESETYNKVKEDYLEAKNKWDNNDFNYDRRFRKEILILSDNINNCTIKEVKEIIEEYELEITRTKGEVVGEKTGWGSVNGAIDIDGYNDADGYFIPEEVYFNTRVYVLNEDEDVIEYFSKEELKNIIKEKLKPESELYAITVDCKLLQLFKDGNIDWLTLQKLTYTNCNL